MVNGFFITGTDTAIGKTWVTLSLISALKKKAYDVVGMKPIATGAAYQDGKLVNDDARLIMANCSKPVAYELVNPFVFELAGAPAIAARHAQKTIEIAQISACFERLTAHGEMIIVEGIGGWRVSLSASTFLVEIVQALRLPVILVVGIRLGCINHAVLTAEAIAADGVTVCGWISNHLAPSSGYEKEVVDELKDLLDCPHLADLPYRPDLVADGNAFAEIKLEQWPSWLFK